MSDMPHITAQQGVTLDALMTHLEADKRAEVIDGLLVDADPMTASYTHIEIINNIYDLIRPFVKVHRLGYFHSDGLTCVLHRNEHRIQVARIPDLCFIRPDRMPQDWDRSTPFPGAPNLAIEVVSPSERTEDTLRKVRDYLTYGTEEIWVVYPAEQVVYRYSQSEPKIAHIYYAADTLPCEDFFPDLSLNVSDFFLETNIES